MNLSGNRRIRHATFSAVLPTALASQYLPNILQQVLVLEVVLGHRLASQQQPSSANRPHCGATDRVYTLSIQ